MKGRAPRVKGWCSNLCVNALSGDSAGLVCMIGVLEEDMVYKVRGGLLLGVMAEEWQCVSRKDEELSWK